MLRFCNCLPPDKPGPPVSLKPVEVTERSITLKWAEPESDGGSDITGYVIEVREAIRRAWSKAGSIEATDKKQFTVSPLIAGEKYLFRVAAENSVGIGDFEEMMQAVVAKSQHGKQCDFNTAECNK